MEKKKSSSSRPGKLPEKDKNMDKTERTIRKQKGEDDNRHVSDDPVEKFQIDDDPGGTQRKIPRMKY